MKILVAGGAGFIGSHLCEKLLNLGYQVICVDNLITGCEFNVSPLKEKKDFVFIKKDISYPLNVDEEINVIFHLASPASPNYQSPISYHKLAMETMLANTQGTLNLLNLALKNKAKFIFASTSEVYGDPLKHPQKETYFGNVNPIGDRAVYDESKRFGETLTYYFYRKYGLNISIARIFNTYGPRMRIDDKRMVVNFIINALKNKPLTIFGTGKQTRSLCYIDDLINGLVKIMKSKKSKGEVFNLGTTEEKSVLDYAQLIIKLTNSQSKIIFEKKIIGDPEKRKPDISKIKHILNWEPKTNLIDGLKKTINYYRTLI